MTTLAEEQADWGTILSSFDFFDDGEKLSYAKKFNDEGYDVEMMKLMSFKDFVEQFHMPMKKALKLAVFLKKRDRVEESPPSAAAVSASSSSSSPASSASSAEKALSDLGIDNTAREAARQAVEMFQQQQQQQQAPAGASNFGASHSALSDHVGKVDPETIKLIQQEKFKSKMCSTLQKHLRDLDWFKKSFGKEFMLLPQGEIIDILANYVLNSTSEKQPSGLQTKFHNLIATLAFRDHALDPMIAVLKSSIGSAISRKAKRSLKAGTTVKWVEFTKKDVLHVLHCILERHKGRIPYWELQRICMITIGLSTGRRWGELIMIAIGSIRIEFTDKGFRRLHIPYCWSKSTGCGLWSQTITESEDGAKLTIAFILDYMQRIGAIPSALAVWNREAELVIDPAKFETQEALCNKLQRSVETAKKQCIDLLDQKLASANARIQAGDVAGAEDDVDSDKAMMPANVFTELKKLDKEDSLVSMWHSQDSGSGRLKRERIDYNGARPVNAFVSMMGYTPSHELRAGITSTRKGFRNDSQGETAQGFAIQRHLNINMDHDERTASLRYDNKQAYRSGVPANIAQPDCPREAALEAIKEHEVQPAYAHPGFFSENVTPRSGELPWGNLGEAYLMQQAVTLPLVGNLECTGHGCNATFHFENDLFCHMKGCKSQEFDCPYCDESGMEPENFLGEHLNARGAKSRQCTKKPGNFRLTKDQKEHDAALDFMTPHKCQFCKLRFATKKNLAQHEKEKHGKGKKKSIAGKKTVKQAAAKKTTISKNSAPKKPAAKKSIPVKRTASQSTTEAMPPLLETAGGNLAGGTAERTVLGELSGVENGIGVQRSNRRSKRLKKSTMMKMRAQPFTPSS